MLREQHCQACGCRGPPQSCERGFRRSRVRRLGQDEDITGAQPFFKNIGRLCHKVVHALPIRRVDEDLVIELGILQKQRVQEVCMLAHNQPFISHLVSCTSIDQKAQASRQAEIVPEGMRGLVAFYSKQNILICMPQQMLISKTIELPDVERSACMHRSTFAHQEAIQRRSTAHRIVDYSCREFKSASRRGVSCYIE